MRALEAEVVDAVWAATRTVAAGTARASAGLSPPTGAGPAVLVGAADSPDDRIVVGRHRSDPRSSSLRHHAASTTRRVDRGRGVRTAPHRSARRVRPHHRARPRPRSPSTAACTRPRAAGRAPARTPLIVGSWAGSGPSLSTVTACRSAGRSTAPTATTYACSNPLSTTSPRLACSSTSTRSISTAATTPAPCASGSPPTASTDAVIQRRGTKEPGKKQPVRLGLRWIVEATNTWWSNYGQLRRNTDRRTRHRHAALCLATVVLIIGKLITWRDRWSPT